MPLTLIFELSTSLLAIALFVWLLIRHNYFEAMVLCMALILGLFIEYLGINKFHLHFYSADFLLVFGTHPKGVPLVIGFGWALVFFTTRRMAARLVSPWWLIPSVAGLLALSLDFFLDPMLSNNVIVPQAMASLQSCISLTQGSGFGVGLWTWCLPPEVEVWWGVPLANYLGWFITVAGYALVLETAVRWYYIPAMPLWRQFWMLVLVLIASAVLIVAGLWFFNLLVGYGVRSLWVLIVFCGFGIVGLYLSGLQRIRWGFEWRAIGLLALDTLICWFAYFAGYFSPQPDLAVVIGLALVNVVAWGLALWILIPWPWFAIPPTPAPFTINIATALSNQTLLDAMKRKDPPADAVMAALFTTPGDIPAVNVLLGKWANSHDPNFFTQLPAPLQAFITQQQQVVGVDITRIAKGQDLFIEYSGICVTALMMASLPEAYAQPTSGLVIGRTQRLLPPKAFRRIVETAQFLVYIMSPKGLLTPVVGNADIGRGITAILRVRLMHAAIRWLILNGQSNNLSPGPAYESMGWNPPTPGSQPVSQLELVYTLMTFCWVTLRALRDSGAVFTEQQANDYVYTWRLVGLHLGIEPALMPNNVHEAAGLFQQIKGMTTGPSPDGPRLTKAVEEVMVTMMQRKASLGSALNSATPRLIMAEFVDQNTRDLLGVAPLTPFEQLVLQPALRAALLLAGWIDNATDEGAAYAVKKAVGRQILLYFAAYPNEVGTDLFDIPPGFLQP